MFTQFEASLPQKIAGLEWSAPADSAGLLERAVVELARLDVVAGQILSPLSSFLLRNEAQSSSKIERVFTSQDELAKAALGLKSSAGATETLAAAEAIEDLIASSSTGNPASAPALNSAHHRLMRHDLLDAKHAGAWRTMQNWIGGSDHSPRGAVHVPPPAEDVADYMADLEAFVARSDLPALAQAALAHAQFESIHPYTDGNGRIGRALINAILRKRGITVSTIVPIASAFAAKREWYFALVNEYRTGDVDLFVDFLAASALLAASEALVSADRLRQLPEVWAAAAPSRAGSAASTLVGSLLEHPLVTAESAARIAGVSDLAARTAISTLERAGVLRSISDRKRDRAWAAGDVLDEAESLVGRIAEQPQRLLTPRVATFLTTQGLLATS